jgi:hypothetical protein
MALNFPNNPTLGQIYTENDKSFIWNGSVWLYKNEYLEIKTAIANAINEKGGSVTTATPFHMYPNAITELSGGLTINGLIESYKVKAGENISAGDFVDFVTQQEVIFGSAVSGSNFGENTSGNTRYMYALNETTAIYLYDGGMGGGYRPYLKIITFENNTINIGNEVQISAQGGTYPRFTKLNDTKGIIMYDTSMVVFSYINNVVSFGTPVALPDGSSLASRIITLTETKAIIFFNSGGPFGVAALAELINISGTNLTLAGNRVSVAPQSTTVNFQSYTPIGVALNSSSVILLYQSETQPLVSKIVKFTIDGTSISAGDSIAVEGTTQVNTSSLDIIAVSDTKAVISFSPQSNQQGYLKVLTIDGNNLSLSNSFIFSSTQIKNINLVYLENDKFIVGYANESDSTFNLKQYTLNGTEISNGSVFVNTNNTYYLYNLIDMIFLTKLNNNKLVVPLSDSNYNLFPVLFNLSILEETEVINAVDTIIGVAKTGGTAGETIEVFVKE